MRDPSPLRPDEVLFFLHIPKTAGVSLYEIITPNFAPDETFPVSELLGNEGIFKTLSAQQLARTRCVHGHFWFGAGDRAVHDFLDPDPVIITLLRDPIARTISVYQFTTAKPTEVWLSKAIVHPELETYELEDVSLNGDDLDFIKSMSLEDFLRHPDVEDQVRNLQARVIVGRDAFGDRRGQLDFSDEELLRRAKERLDRFAFVGLSDRVEESVELLAETFCWQPPTGIPRLNRSPVRSESFELSPEALDAISELTKVDRELYEHAQRLFDVRVGAVAG